MKKWVVQQNGKTITSVYNQWSMAHSFLQSHITLPIYKELKIVEITINDKNRQSQAP